MEFALESSTPFSASSRAKASSPKMRLTPVCASPKLPFTAQTWVFSPSWVIIWSFCAGETPSTG